MLHAHPHALQLYCLLFSCLCLRYIQMKESWLGARVESPYINKIMPFQNFLPRIHTLQRLVGHHLQWWLNDETRTCPESGCKWLTPWQTSVSSVTVTSLCLTAGKPPVLQVRACSTVNGCPQLQWDGEFWSGQPYLRERLSLEAALCRAKPSSSTESAISQVEAPLSWASSMDRWRGVGRFH